MAQYGGDYYDDDGDYPAEDSAARVLLCWVFGAISALALALLLGLLSFSQLSERKPAEALLARAMIHLSQVDDLLETSYYTSLHDTAEAAEREGSLVTLPEFPVDLALEPTDILDTPREDLREVILRRSAEEIYDKGLDAFSAPGNRVDIERLSPGGTIEMTLGNLNRDAHDSAESWIQLVGIVALIAVALFVLLGRGFGRVTLLGVVVLAGSLLALGGVFLVRGLLRTLTSGDGDPFADGLNEVVAEAAGLPVQNAMTFAVLGVGILMFGLVMTLISRRFEYSG